jgi:hypothetical protein
VNGLADGNWIAIRLEGRTSTRDAVGAEIIVELQGRTLRRIVGNYAYTGQFDNEVVIGLGIVPSIIDLRVRWPGGEEESFGPREHGRRISLVQGEGSVVQPPTEEAAATSGVERFIFAGVLCLVLLLGLVYRARGSND